MEEIVSKQIYFSTQLSYFIESCEFLTRIISSKVHLGCFFFLLDHQHKRYHRTKQNKVDPGVIEMSMNFGNKKYNGCCHVIILENKLNVN